MKIKLIILSCLIAGCIGLAFSDGLERRENGKVYKITGGNGISVSPNAGTGNVTVTNSSVTEVTSRLNTLDISTAAILQGGATPYLNINSGFQVKVGKIGISTGTVAISTLTFGGVEASTPTTGYNPYTLILNLESMDLLISTETVVGVRSWKKFKSAIP